MTIIVLTVATAAASYAFGLWLISRDEKRLSHNGGWKR